MHGYRIDALTDTEIALKEAMSSLSTVLLERLCFGLVVLTERILRGVGYN